MSLLVYHFDGHCIYTVDYRHRRSIGTHRIGAVTHSGDITMPDDEFGTGGRKMVQLGDIDCEGLVRPLHFPMPRVLLIKLHQEKPASPICWIALRLSHCLIDGHNILEGLSCRQQLQHPALIQHTARNSVKGEYGRVSVQVLD